MALAPQSRRASGMVGMGAVAGNATGTVAAGTVSGGNGGTHPYAAASAGTHMRGASQGQGQGRYVGYFGDSGGMRRVVHEPGIGKASGGSATMGMETARGMGMQDEPGGEHEDRKGFWGVLCCR